MGEWDENRPDIVGRHYWQSGAEAVALVWGPVQLERCRATARMMPTHAGVCRQPAMIRFDGHSPEVISPSDAFGPLVTATPPRCRRVLRALRFAPATVPTSCFGVDTGPAARRMRV